MPAERKQGFGASSACVQELLLHARLGHAHLLLAFYHPTWPDVFLGEHSLCRCCHGCNRAPCLLVACMGDACVLVRNAANLCLPQQLHMYSPAFSLQARKVSGVARTNDKPRLSHSRQLPDGQGAFRSYTYPRENKSEMLLWAFGKDWAATQDKAGTTVSMLTGMAATWQQVVPVRAAAGPAPSQV